MLFLWYNRYMKKFKNIYVEITRACNLKCSFCPSKDYTSKDFIEESQFKYIIDEIKNYTKGIYLHILGEPLLHPKLFDFIDYASKVVEVNITTNGHLINKTLEKLINSNISNLNISLQSLVKFDEDYIVKYFESLSKLIQNRTNMYPIHLRMWNDKLNSDTKKTNELILKLIEKFKLIDNNYVNLSVADEFRWPTLTDPINDIKSTCLGGKHQIGILLNGNIVLCCLDYLGHTKIGNIYDETLGDVLSSFVFDEVKKAWDKTEHHFELCKKCTFRNRFKKEN